MDEKFWRDYENHDYEGRISYMEVFVKSVEQQFLWAAIRDDTAPEWDYLITYCQLMKDMLLAIHDAFLEEESAISTREQELGQEEEAFEERRQKAASDILDLYVSPP